MKFQIPTDDALLRRIQRPEFQLVRGDTALEGQDPHAVGVAIKAAAVKDIEPSLMGRKPLKRSKSTKGFGR